MIFTLLSSKYMDYQKTKLKASTIKSKQSIIDSLIMPYFKDKQSDGVDVECIQEWRKQLECNDSIRVVTKNVAISTLKNLLFFATRVNNLTVEEFNKLSFVLEPIKDYEIEEDEASNFITNEQREELIKVMNKKNIQNKYLYMFITDVLFFTGMRKSELRGLKVNKINLEEGSISIVSQKLNSNVAQDNVSLKSKLSRRTILLDTDTRDMILDHIKRFNLKGDDYLIPDVLGSYARFLETCAKKIGVDKLTPHGLRHSHCSYLIQLYMEKHLVPDFGAIAARLGHNVENTMNVYYHMYPQQQKVLIDLLNK